MLLDGSELLCQRLLLSRIGRLPYLVLDGCGLLLQCLILLKQLCLLLLLLLLSRWGRLRGGPGCSRSLRGWRRSSASLFLEGLRLLRKGLHLLLIDLELL